MKFLKTVGFLSLICLFISACNGKIPGADARKVSADPKERVKKNLEEGRGIKLNDVFGGDKSGKFDFEWIDDNGEKYSISKNMVVS